VAITATLRPPRTQFKDTIVANPQWFETDWRLGLGFLRAMLDVNYRSGLDGRWTAFPEIIDWPEIAESVRNELRRLNPEARAPIAMGDLKLPGLKVRTGEDVRYYVMVHPLWRTDKSARETPSFKSVIKDACGSGRHIGRAR
jgi:hypothetical protein